jgi:hypothetical protein
MLQVGVPVSVGQQHPVPPQDCHRHAGDLLSGHLAGDVALNRVEPQHRLALVGQHRLALLGQE